MLWRGREVFDVVERVDDVGRLIDLGTREDGGDFSRLFHRHDVAAAAYISVRDFADADVVVDLVQVRV